MPHAEGVGRRSARIFTELVVIIVGVLIALAADRWNQARAARASEAAYLTRFAEEIGEDSTRAAGYLESRPVIIAQLDSLIAFVDGAGVPPNVVGTVLSVSRELSLPQPVAWIEIQATNSLDLITDSGRRTALTEYYAERERIQLMWRRQDSRARDPFWDQLYGIGLFDPKDEFGSAPARGVEAFRSWPDMRRHLMAVGAGHYFQAYNADRLLEVARQALAALREPRSAASRPGPGASR